MGSKLAEAEAAASFTLRTVLIVIGIFLFIIVGLIIASQFTNGLIRVHAQRAMNEKLKGYHTELTDAYLNLITGNLTLKGVTVVQNAHPAPPVMQIPSITAHIQWTALVTGHVVAGFVIRQPHLHINLTQLEQQANNNVSVSQEGWQQALQNLYPFKINEIRVEDATLTYVGANQQQPLQLEHLYIVAGNIRNIYSPNKTYPSTLWARGTAFNQGILTIDGYANYLARPFAGIWVQYWVERLPLDPFDPVLGRANLRVQHGILNSSGELQYAPWIEQAEVYNATIDNIHLLYTHFAQTTTVEQKHVSEVKHAAKEVNNKPGLQLKIDKLLIEKSWFGYDDKTAKPPYTLFFSNLSTTVTNFSNQFAQGTAVAHLTGKFMGSGDTIITADFRSQRQGPDFVLNAAIKGTDLTSLNDLFRNYGKLDVAGGLFSVFSQMTVREGEMSGYVKPLFTDLKVYSYKQDKNQSWVKQLYEMAVGAVSHLVRNPSTEKVATQTDITGKLDKPNVGTWQALAEVIRNAFIKAILPGFNEQVAHLTPAGAPHVL
jgi:hypothetical protein